MPQFTVIAEERYIATRSVEVTVEAETAEAAAALIEEEIENGSGIEDLENEHPGAVASDDKDWESLKVTKTQPKGGE